ncbi:hypothetical protein DEDE109153_08940 [Deinococcus deserti]
MTNAEAAGNSDCQGRVHLRFSSLYGRVQIIRCQLRVVLANRLYGLAPKVCCHASEIPHLLQQMPASVPPCWVKTPEYQARSLEGLLGLVPRRHHARVPKHMR